MMQTYKDLVEEARLEVTAAQQNLREAITTWEAVIANLHPAALLLQAAERRLERANALLRSAASGVNHD